MTKTINRVVLIICAALVLPTLGASPAEPSSARGLLLVANKGDHTLGIIDPEAGRQIATVPEDGITGHEVVASPDGRTAYVPIYGDSGVGKPGSDGRTMAVIDVASHRLLKTFDFGKPERPHCALFGPKNGLLYVTTELSNDVTIIDPRTLKIVGRVPTGQAESHMLAITRDGRRGYTSNVGPGTVSALDLAGRKTIAVIPVSGQAQRIALSADDRWAFTADQTKPQLAVIDTRENKVKTWIPLPALAYGTAATADGKWLLVTLPAISKVGVVDLNSMKVMRTVDVVKFPQEILIRPDGHAAFVSCDHDHKIAVINLTDWKAEKLLDAGHGADGLAWAR